MGKRNLAVLLAVISLMGCGGTPAKQADTSGGEKLSTVCQEAEETLRRGTGYSRESLEREIYEKHEGVYSKKEVTQAVDNLEEMGRVDWDEEAYEAALGYIESGMGFSKKGLFWQMTGNSGSAFTEREAKKAMNRLIEDGRIDWDREAEKAAKNILCADPEITDAALKKELVSEDGYAFTNEQAWKAVDALQDVKS